VAAAAADGEAADADEARASTLWPLADAPACEANR
jgi:hypothetical protein